MLYLVAPHVTTVAAGGLLCEHNMLGDGVQRLRRHPAVDCDAPMHYGLWWWVAVGGSVLYGLGVPFAFWLTLRLRRSEVKNRRSSARLAARDPRAWRTRDVLLLPHTRSLTPPDAARRARREARASLFLSGPPRSSVTSHATPPPSPRAPPQQAREDAAVLSLTCTTALASRPPRVATPPPL